MNDKQHEDKIDRCDGCSSTRVLGYYQGLWLCKTGPRCWRRRKAIHQVRLNQRRRNELGRKTFK